MANQVGGDTDFGADFARGASIANMRAMRQERMIQLQGEQALQAVQERHLAAQADALVYQLQQAKAQKATDDSDLENFNLSRHILKEQVDPMPGETPADTNARIDKATLTSLIAKNPKVGLQVVTAQNALEKPELAQAALTTRENVAQLGAAQREQASQNRLTGVKYAADQRMAAATAKLTAAGVPLDAAGKYAKELEDARAGIAAAQESGDPDALDKAELKLSDIKSGMASLHPDRMKEAGTKYLTAKAQSAYKAWLDSGMQDKGLEAEYKRIEGEVAAQGQAAKGAAPTAAKASGKRIQVKSKDGKLFTVPEGQLEEARRAGYAPVE